MKNSTKFLLCALCGFFLAACSDKGNDANFVAGENAESEMQLSSNSIASSSEIERISSTDVIASSSAAKQSDSLVSSSSIEYGSLTDSRDGRIYRTVVIGSQTWMAENLNYETLDSYCYKDSPDSCEKYGRVYTWAGAMDSAAVFSTNSKDCGYGRLCIVSRPARGICPEGWHIPHRVEFDSLIVPVGGINRKGTMLKSTSGWFADINGTDVYGFSAYPLGYRHTSGEFKDVGYRAYFWSSTEDFEYNAYYMHLYYASEIADIDKWGKYNAFAVRCIQD